MAFLEIAMGLGRALASASYDRRLWTSYLRQPRFEFIYQPVAAPRFVEDFHLIRSPKGMATTPGSVARNEDAVMMFVIKPMDPHLITVPQCFPGTARRPPVVLLTQPLDDRLTPGALFELFHELGHASIFAADTEALCFVEPLIAFVAATAFVVAVGREPWTLGAAGIYLLLRLFYWVTRRLKIEPELIADGMALRHLHRFWADPSHASDLEAYLANCIMRRRGTFFARRAQLHRLVMLRLHASRIRETGPDGINVGAINYSFLILAADLAIISSPIWTASHPISVAMILTFAAVPSAAGLVYCLHQLGRSSDRLTRELKEMAHGHRR